jgi:hypothetical protein
MISAGSSSSSDERGRIDGPSDHLDENDDDDDEEEEGGGGRGAAAAVAAGAGLTTSGVEGVASSPSLGPKTASLSVVTIESSLLRHGISRRDAEERMMRESMDNMPT